MADGTPAKVAVRDGISYYLEMTQRERHLLAIRFMEIETELQWIADGRVVDGDPSIIEGDLLDEQEEIEFKLGQDYFEQRDGFSEAAG